MKILFEERKKITTESLAEGNAQTIIKSLAEIETLKTIEERSEKEFNYHLFIKA